MRSKYKELVMKQTSDEKQLKQAHKSVVDLEEQCRRMQNAINDSKRVRSRPKPAVKQEVKQVTQSEVESFRQE